jgi:Imm-5 like putative immunity protein
MKFWDLFQLGDDPDPEVLNQEIAAIESAAKGLFGQRRRLFVCDCVERALPIYEKRFPDDDRPRTAIMEARRSVFGIAAGAALVTVHQAAEDAYEEASRHAPEEFHGDWPPVLIAKATWMGSIANVEKLEPAEVCRLILRAVQSTSPQVLRESRWQYKQLQWYLEQGPLIVPPRPAR